MERSPFCVYSSARILLLVNTYGAYQAEAGFGLYEAFGY